MVWNSDRTVTLAELQREAQTIGTFVDRAIVRELKISCNRFAETDSAWTEIATLIERWKEGMNDLEVLSSMQRLNRISTCWKDPAQPSPIA